MWYFISPKVVFGEDALDYLSEIRGRQALIVTDRVLRRLAAESIAEKLREAGVEVELYDGVEAEPTTSCVARGLEAARRVQPDLIVAVGGGSCIDTAKAIWALYENPELSIEEIAPLAELKLREKARLIAIPTTSGTGSEATWAAVITDPAEHRKMELAHHELIPDIAIVDPRLARSMPPKLTAATGMDVLAHAIEAYVSQWANDFTDGLALKAIELVFSYLPRAYRNPDDMEAREKMHNAATIAGLAFSNSMIGVAHALAHAIGGVFKIPHGEIVGVCLPYTIEYDLPEAEDRLEDIAHHLRLSYVSKREAGLKLADEVRRLLSELRLPSTLAESGVSERELEENMDKLVKLAASSSGTTVNPRIPSHEDYRRLLKYMYEGRRVDF